MAFSQEKEMEAGQKCHKLFLPAMHGITYKMVEIV